MTGTRCVHGVDSRFCAICNRSGRGVLPASDAVDKPSLAEVLRFLGEARTRATYGAVAAVVGVPPQSIGAVLGERRPDVSWVVNAHTGLLTAYAQSDWHPELLSNSAVIRTGTELTLRLVLWRAKAK
jgi:alkylated DNA nucleotide flippase Atl1